MNCPAGISGVVLLLLAVATAAPQRATGIVNTQCGPIQGVVEEHGLWLFAGIPYSVPPVGERRWKAPEPLSPSTGCPHSQVFQATNLNIACVQPGLDSGKEDCLVLHVWTKPLTEAPKKLKPVMVYIHGGGLITGSGSSTGEKPWRFAKNVVLRESDYVGVSINYRLGVMGFMALDALAKHDRGRSGNYGFMDQILALKWVRDNIAFFGGDPNRVTISGQSSGGTSVLALMISPLAKGLFHSAISMSSSPALDAPYAQVANTNLDSYVPTTSCAKFASSEDDLYNCLIKADVNELVKLTPPSWAPGWFFGLPIFGEQIGSAAIVDGEVIVKSLDDSFIHKVGSDVPIIIGNMAEEPDFSPYNIVINYTQSEYTQFIYKQFAAWGSDFGANVLNLYNSRNQFTSVQQSYDMIVADTRMVCGNLHAAQVASSSLKSVYFYNSPQGPSSPECAERDGNAYCPRYAYHTFDLATAWDDAGDIWSPLDKAYGTVVFKRFADFGINGGSFTNSTSEPVWPKFQLSNPAVMRLARHSQVVIADKYPECSFWMQNGFRKYWIQN